MCEGAWPTHMKMTFVTCLFSVLFSAGMPNEVLASGGGLSCQGTAPSAVQIQNDSIEKTYRMAAAAGATDQPIIPENLPRISLQGVITVSEEERSVVCKLIFELSFRGLGSVTDTILYRASLMDGSDELWIEFIGNPIVIPP